MKNADIKILAVILFFVAILYIGVEPFAHSQMHKSVERAEFKYDGSGEDEAAVKYWEEINTLSQRMGDHKKGEALVQMACIGCHGIKSKGIVAPMDDATASMSFGISPPDLSNAGAIYDKRFLIALVKDPAKATNVNHKFDSMNPHPMPQFYGMGGDIDEEVSDIVAYLQHISSNAGLSPKEVFVDACVRCHDMKYDGVKKTTTAKALKKYMGSTPPDLSMIIRSKSKEYLNNFLNNPNAVLPGTSMPRVGLTKESSDKVVNYLESIGDSKKAERERVIPIILAVLVFISILAWFWKKYTWKRLKK